jgi:hypothetical protein
MTDQHTPGPWVWRGNAHAQDVYLSTRHGGRRIVMGFKRWGTANAQPTFRGQNSLEDAKDLLKFEVGDPSVTGVAEARENNSVYRLHIADIDHPDARLIEAAPELWDLIVELFEDPELSLIIGGNPNRVSALMERADKLRAKVRGTQ